MLHKYKQFLNERRGFIYIPSEETRQKVVDTIKEHPKKSAAAAIATTALLGYGLYKGRKAQIARWEAYGCDIERYEDQYQACLRYMKKKKAKMQQQQQ